MNETRSTLGRGEEPASDPSELAAEQGGEPAELAAERGGEPTPPPLELSEIRLGRLSVPEDADDILSLVHRQPGVVHVWMSGDALCVESAPGTFNCEACVEQLLDLGFPAAHASA